MSSSIIYTISDLILLHENRIRMESEDAISALVQKVSQLQDAVQFYSEKLNQKRAQLDWVFAKYIEMKDKVLLSGVSHTTEIKSKNNRLSHGSIQGEYANAKKKSRAEPQFIHSNVIEGKDLTANNHGAIDFKSNTNGSSSNGNGIIDDNSHSRRQKTELSGTVGKFVGELSRSKAARAALPGHECQDCQKFYEAMMQQGIFGPDDKMDMLKQCSRHKATW